MCIRDSAKADAYEVAWFKKRRLVSAEAIARHGASIAITEADTRSVSYTHLDVYKRQVDALSELEEIEQAVSRLFNPTYRFILYSRFLKNVPDSAYVIYTELGIEKTRYQELLDRALLAFAWQYRGAVLVCEKR